MYNKLQYISQGNTAEEQLLNIRKALESGCQWIQLRFKTQNVSELFSLAESTKLVCAIFKAVFIINDNVPLAKQIEADGVHLGLSDMKIKDARAILSNTKIIGGTANTFEDIQNHIQNSCDYIGLGPFQFTTTKEKLSPILGLEGYHSIIERMKSHSLEVPIYAIGGIQLENVESLIEIGIHGIAVSGLIANCENPKQLIAQLNKKLYGTI